MTVCETEPLVAPQWAAMIRRRSYNTRRHKAIETHARCRTIGFRIWLPCQTWSDEATSESFQNAIYETPHHGLNPYLLDPKMEPDSKIMLQNWSGRQASKITSFLAFCVLYQKLCPGWLFNIHVCPWAPAEIFPEGGKTTDTIKSWHDFGAPYKKSTIFRRA